MKKILFTFLAALIIGFVTPATLNAAEMSAGATAWFSWWDFHNPNDTNGDPKIDPSLLYGPALSLKLSDSFNMTFVFLYGLFELDQSNGTTEEIHRIDSDLALNYRLNNYFKFFFGLKYMGYSMENFYHRGAGAGTGISAVFPLTGNFFILGNLSGLLIYTTEDNNTDKTDFIEYGGNSGLSLAYYIVPASTTVSLGGRYQLFRSHYDDSSNDKDATHQFYGVTLSVTYSFNL